MKIEDIDSIILALEGEQVDATPNTLIIECSKENVERYVDTLISESPQTPQPD